MKEGAADAVTRSQQEAATALQEAETRHSAEVERLAAAAQKASAELLAERQCVAALKVPSPFHWPAPGQGARFGVLTIAELTPLLLHSSEGLR